MSVRSSGAVRVGAAVLAVLAAGSGAGPGAGAASAAQPVAPADRGREIAESLCAGCHAVGPSGASPEAAAPAFRTLHERWPVEYLAEALAEGIVVGHSADPAMPEFRFDPDEIDALIAYLEALDHPDGGGGSR